jgi:hypothetical protein
VPEDVGIHNRLERRGEDGHEGAKNGDVADV